MTTVSIEADATGRRSAIEQSPGLVDNLRPSLNNLMREQSCDHMTREVIHLPSQFHELDRDGAMSQVTRKTSPKPPELKQREF